MNTKPSTNAVWDRSEAVSNETWNSEFPWKTKSTFRIKRLKSVGFATLLLHTRSKNADNSHNTVWDRSATLSNEIKNSNSHKNSRSVLSKNPFKNKSLASPVLVSRSPNVKPARTIVSDGTWHFAQILKFENSEFSLCEQLRIQQIYNRTSRDLRSRYVLLGKSELEFLKNSVKWCFSKMMFFSFLSPQRLKTLKMMHHFSE